MSKTSIASPLRVGAASLLAAALAGAGCAKQTAAGLVRESIPVTVGTASRQDVPVEVRAIGHVEPYSTVSVKARVAGEVTKVGFREGQDVRKGDLLFQIDPRPYEASLAQARAQLERDRAVAKNAEDQIRRYADLVQKDSVTKEQFDTTRSGAAAALAFTGRPTSSASVRRPSRARGCSWPTAPSWPRSTAGRGASSSTPEIWSRATTISLSSS